MKYVEFVRSVESTSFHAPNQRLLHAAMGICTEVGELLELESVEQMMEELGDLLWYVALGLDALGADFDGVEPLEVSIRGETPAESLIILGTDLLDLVKKQIFYGREFDAQVAIDLLYGLQVVISAGLKYGESDWTMDDLIEANVKKLMKRYPEKFSEAAANERDVKAEYAAMSA